MDLAKISDEQRIEELTQPLTKHQKLVVERILRHTPASALPGHWKSNVDTFEDVVNALDSISTFLKGEMNDAQKLRDRQDGFTRDLAAVGRIAKLMMTEAEADR